jgi:hypothetical protein
MTLIYLAIPQTVLPLGTIRYRLGQRHGLQNITLTNVFFVKI